MVAGRGDRREPTKKSAPAAGLSAQKGYAQLCDALSQEQKGTLWAGLHLKAREIAGQRAESLGWTQESRIRKLAAGPRK